MATQRDLEEINRQYPNGPDGPRIDDVMRSVAAHPWGETRKPQTAWPERDYYESTEDYLVGMVQQLFVEMAELRTLVASQESERT